MIPFKKFIIEALSRRGFLKGISSATGVSSLGKPGKLLKHVTTALVPKVFGHEIPHHDSDYASTFHVDPGFGETYHSITHKNGNFIVRQMYTGRGDYGGGSEIEKEHIFKTSQDVEKHLHNHIKDILRYYSEDDPERVKNLIRGHSKYAGKSVKHITDLFDHQHYSTPEALDVAYDPTHSHYNPDMHIGEPPKGTNLQVPSARVMTQKSKEKTQPKQQEPKKITNQSSIYDKYHKHAGDTEGLMFKNTGKKQSDQLKKDDTYHKNAGITSGLV